MACQLPCWHAVDAFFNRLSRRWLGIAALSAFAVILGGIVPDSANAAEAVATRRVAGRLIVRQRAGLSPEALARALDRSGAAAVGSLSELGAIVLDASEADLADVERSLRLSGLFKDVDRDYLATTADIPDDPYFGSQWGLQKVAAPLSWTLSTGAPSVPVAVLDTGVELTHPDLIGQLLPGFDFVNNDSDPSDDNGHGTRMTGIIVGRRNNAEGGVGVAPDSRVMPLKVMGADGTGAYSDVASGITYAVDHGARVINLSLVGSAPSGLLQSAIDYATAHGVVAVAASGNGYSSTPTYPAAFPGVVAVGATNASDIRASFSNYGAWLSLAAPGVDVVTTSPGGVYTTSTGTSPAAAFASGVFALLLGAEPGLTGTAAIQRVLDGAADLGSSGWDPYYGFGRADAYAALVPGQVGSPPPDTVNPTVEIVSPSRGSLVWGTVPIDVAAADDGVITRVELFIDNRLHATETNAPYAFALDAASFTPGTHKLRAYAYDASGNSARSRSIKVSFTPGVGLLVRKAKARQNSASLTATFALPAGASFDPAQDAVSVTLSNAGGTVFSATADTSDMVSSAPGQAKATVGSVMPAEGTVRITVTPSGGFYSLRVAAVDLQSMGVTSLMDLTLHVGATQLSQSLAFRAKKPTLMVYP